MHRVAQAVRHVRASVAPDETARAHALLPPSAAALFDSMPVADRRHGLDVARRLLAAGFEDADLLAAALLHDAAKGHAMRLWHRSAGVLLERFAPGLLHRLASADPDSWRHPFYLYLHHARLSADAVLQAGCGERCAELIRGESAEVRLQQALLAADDAS